MKKILLGVLVLVVILVAGVAIFIATFDANRYRPQLIQKAQEFLAKPVRLDRISLAWNNGIALEIKGFAVYTDASKKTAALSLDQASMNLRLLPLLKKEIQISSLTLSGLHFYVERASDGRMLIPGVPPNAASGGKQPAASNVKSSAPLSIRSIRLKDGEINFKDLSSQPPLHLSIRQINAAVQDFSLTTPFTVKVQAAIFSDRPNADFGGTLCLPQPGRAGVLDNAALKVSLAEFKSAEMIQSLPALAPIGLEEGLAGTLEVGIKHLNLDADAAKNLKASIRLEGGGISFNHLPGKPPLRLAIRQIDAAADDFSLSDPFAFTARAAIFSDRQDIDLSGKLALPQGTNAAILDEALLKVSLAYLKTAEIIQSFPALAEAGLEDGLAGALELGIGHLKLDADAAKNIKASIRLADGKILLKPVGSPIDKIQLDSMLEKNALMVKSFSAGFAQGTVALSGVVNPLIGPVPATSAKVSVKDMSLKSLITKQAAAGPRVEGLVSAEFNGKASGLDWPAISRTLSGSGHLGLQNLSLINFNVVREVFSRLEVIPGVTESLRAKLPDNYRAKIDAPNTTFAPIDVPVTIANGRIHFDSLNLATDHYILQARGEVGFDQSIGAQAVIRISPELSAAAVRGVNDLQYLQNSQGELEIPFQIKGVIPNIKVIPDLTYAAQRLATSKVQEVVSDLLNKSLKGKQQEPVKTDASAESSPESAITGFLQEALKKNK